LVSISHEPAGSASTCESETKDDTAQPATASTAAQRPPIYDGWEIDEQLRHFRRVLGQTPASREKFNEPAAQPRFRVDASHGVAAPHRKRARRLSRKTRQAASAAKQHVPGDRVLAMLAWTTMSLGTMGFVCGLALMSWSANMGRQDLWSIGSPVLLAGQIALVLGLILQIDRVWRNSRRAAARMETVDEQIHDLKTASSLRDTHGPSSAFYAHWASGAGAEILLGDLKSQLDLLAVKLSKP
jgi:hypothetical protein